MRLLLHVLVTVLLPCCLTAASPKNLIFGYGCLINPEVRAAGDSAAAAAIPARLRPSFNYVRTWNFRGPSYCALGLRKSAPGRPINGVVYAVDVEDMAQWDEFEQGYDRVKIPRDQIEFYGWMEPKSDCTIWVYVPKEEVQQLPTPKSPLMQSYLDLILQGCLEYGEDFAKEFLAGTEGWPRWWLNDRVTHPSPWRSRRQQKHLDTLLQAFVPELAYRKDYDAYQRLLGAAPVADVL